MSLIFRKSLRIVQECSRKLTTSAVPRGIEKFGFQGRVLNKFLSNNLERKIRKSGAQPSLKILDKKRVAALNKMYMINISEVMALGEFPGVLDKGIQITRVGSVRDTSLVEVFWVADTNEDKTEVQNLLSSISGLIASKLVYANMLGHVPTIKFIPDLSAVNVEETTKLLDRIAYENSLYEKNKDNAEDATLNKGAVEDLEPQLPPMSTNTFGLPYDRIYRRIQESKRKFYPFQIPAPPTSEEFQKSQQEESEFIAGPVQRNHEQKKAVKKFIRLYQKSTLRSGSRRQQVKSREEFYEVQEEDTYNSYERSLRGEEEGRP
ncbi:Ribosome-binding factor A [Frankliniella fusca]|uniref:Ribosome-binding factor A n=1 Tax=Frankliniella fusca TaxID=407009 RepID=A0AAE1L958_9NEOP|nr:Ribosome-binding factor A [Frankliniella fusca]